MFGILYWTNFCGMVSLKLKRKSACYFCGCSVLYRFGLANLICHFFLSSLFLYSENILVERNITCIGALI